MGKEIVYCEICGDRILEQEFEKGKAVTILNKNYCVKCKGEAVKGISSIDLEEEPKKSGRSSAMMKAVQAKSPQQRGTSVRPATPPRATAPHRPPPTPKASGSKLPLIVGGAIGGIAVIAIVALALVNRGEKKDGGGDPNSENRPTAAKADSAWSELQQEIEAAKKSDDYDRVLAKIEVVRPALAGSAYEAQLETLKSEYKKKKSVADLFREARALAGADSGFQKYPEVLSKFEAALLEATRSSKDQIPAIGREKDAYVQKYEDEATGFFDQLKDEVREYMRLKEWNKAILVIDARFPKHLKHSTVWKGTLDRWYKECEAAKKKG